MCGPTHVLEGRTWGPGQEQRGASGSRRAQQEETERKLTRAALALQGPLARSRGPRGGKEKCRTSCQIAADCEP